MIFARARFSDAQNVASLQEDVVSTDGWQEGYVEALVGRSKSSFTVGRKTRWLPVVLPIRGLEQQPWALSWIETLKKANLPVQQDRPLLPAPAAGR